VAGHMECCSLYRNCGISSKKCIFLMSISEPEELEGCEAVIYCFEVPDLCREVDSFIVRIRASFAAAVIG